MLLAADEEGSDDSVEQLSRGDQEYERKFSEKEAEFCEPQVHFEKKLRISRGRRSYEDNEEVIYPPERKPPIFDFFYGSHRIYCRCRPCVLHHIVILIYVSKKNSSNHIVILIFCISSSIMSIPRSLERLAEI